MTSALSAIARSVEGHDVGKNDRVRQAVMGVEPRTHGVRDRMHAAKTLLEGRGTHRCGGQHLRACLDVLAVRIGPRQEPMDEPHALECDAIRERMEARCAECFETVHERVEAGGRGDRARQSDREFRVGNDDARHHLRVEDDFFLMRLLIEDDTGAADLRARARGGGDRNDRRDAGEVSPRPPVADVLEIPQRARLSRHERHDLADIECRAAAERHDTVVASGAVKRAGPPRRGC